MTHASIACADLARAKRPPCANRGARLAACALWAAGLLLALAPAQAHQSSDAYLQVKAAPAGLTVRWDIALRDLDALVDLDADGDRQLTWGEVRHAWPRIDALALANLSVPRCPLAVTGHALERRADGVYVALSMHAACRPPAALPLRYTLFAGVDASHRGIAQLAYADGRQELRLLDPQHAIDATLRPADAAPIASASFLYAGVHHILTGLDHLLFLLCLLIPAVLRRDAAGWQPVRSPREALLPVLRVVTLFTLAHSITLTLAALGRVDLPPSVIEPAIAATIVLAAVDNLRPVFGRWRGAVTFLFGLVHGFGFASALHELELPPAAFAWALLRFNAGIELGQLAVVLSVVPLLYWLRRRPAYRVWGLSAGSLAAAAVAAVWFVERTAHVSILPALTLS